MSPLMSWELFILIGMSIAILMTRLYRQSRDEEEQGDTPDSVGRLLWITLWITIYGSLYEPTKSLPETDRSL